MSRVLWAALTCWTFLHPVRAQDDLDTRLFLAINSRQNPTHNGVFEALDLSSIPAFVAVPAGFVLVGYAVQSPQTVRAGVLSGVGQVSALGVTVLLKEIVGRQRPFETISSAKVKHRWSAGGASFPSGHTSQSFAIAMALSLHYRSAAVTIPLFVWATAIGYGRVYLGLHYPSDILGGMLIGSAAGLLAWGLRAEFTRISDKIASPPETPGEIGGGLNIVQLQIPLQLLN